MRVIHTTLVALAVALLAVASVPAAIAADRPVGPETGQARTGGGADGSNSREPDDLGLGGSRPTNVPDDFFDRTWLPTGDSDWFFPRLGQ